MEVWSLADDGRKAEVVAHVDLVDGGCCGNVVVSSIFLLQVMKRGSYDFANFRAVVLLSEVRLGGRDRPEKGRSDQK